MATVLVTGCSTGIGLATALALARAGHKVYGTMRSPQRAPELADTAAAEGLPITVLPLDVGDDASVREAFAKVYADGPLDVLVNNAGIGATGPVEELDFQAFRDTMETNYFGAIRCIKAVLPAMRRQRNGCIINVTSIAGRIATAPQSAYVASKWALEGLSEVLAQEVKGFGIRVAIVEPGVIATPIFDKAPVEPPPSHYPHQRRLQAMFDASLSNPVSPDVVGDAILKIVESDSWQLRYPVGPDARPMLTLRRLAKDEEWIDRYAELDDEKWLERTEAEFFGLDLRSRLRPAGPPPAEA